MPEQQKCILNNNIFYWITFVFDISQICYKYKICLTLHREEAAVDGQIKQYSHPGYCSSPVQKVLGPNPITNAVLKHKKHHELLKHCDVDIHICKHCDFLHDGSMVSW